MITHSEVGSMDKKNIFDTTASKGTFFYNVVWRVGSRVVAVFLVVINRIYLHHNLERLIHAPSFWYQVFAR